MGHAKWVIGLETSVCTWVRAVRVHTGRRRDIWASTCGTHIVNEAGKGHKTLVQVELWLLIRALLSKGGTGFLT